MIYDNEKILLGMKKRGFGAGRWNGFGGKVLEGESIEETLPRELLEEAGIVADNLISRGQLNFTFEENDDEVEVHLFSASSFSGQVVETEEMKSQWFAQSEIPYAEMWSDDIYWLPPLLVGKNIKAQFHFDNPQSQTILKKSVEKYD